MAQIDESDDVYPVSDDSLLLLEAVKYARGRVLDMFAGTGVIGLNASESAESVVLTDISDAAIKLIKHNIKKNGIKNARVIKSDAFKNLQNEKFDIILMNPPYLPDNSSVSTSLDLSTIGGKEGQELTIRVIKEIKSHLYKGGMAFLILSSAHSLEKVYKEIESNNLEYSILDSKKFFFEELILVRIHEKRRDIVESKTDSVGRNNRKLGSDISLKGRKRLA